MDNTEISQEGYSSVIVAIAQNLLRLALFAFYCFLLFIIFDHARKEQGKRQIKQIIGNSLKIVGRFIRQTIATLENEYQIKIGKIFENQSQVNEGSLVQKILYHPISRAIMAVFIQAGKRTLELALKIVLISSELVAFLKEQFNQFTGSDEMKKLKILQTLKCPLSHAQFVDPVLINQCGHTFERNFIQKKLAQTPGCPICKVHARRINLKQNYPIKQIISKLACLQQKQTTTKVIKQNNSFLTLLTVVLIFVIVILLLSRPSSTPVTMQVSSNLSDLLLQRFNIVDKSVMTSEEFQAYKNDLFNLFNGNTNADSRFVIKSNGKTHQAILTLQTIKQQSFYVHYQVKGSQIRGSWSGDGYLLTKKGGLYFWMHITNFSGKPALEKLEQDLIYESYIMKRPFDQIKGKWYYLGHITDPNLSGDWSLLDLSKANIYTQNQIVNKEPIKQIAKEQQTTVKNKIISQSENIITEIDQKQEQL